MNFKIPLNITAIFLVLSNGRRILNYIYGFFDGFIFGTRRFKITVAGERELLKNVYNC